MLLISISLVLLNLRLRKEYKQVQAAIIKHPKTSFENLLTQLLIAAEDHRYRSHFGFDPIAIVRAFFRIVAMGRIEGASTIEQQLVRSITGKYKISLLRKIEEIAIAAIISINYGKDDIAYTYLSKAYFGFNFIGYKSVLLNLRSNMSSDECEITLGAYIVALLKRPKPAMQNQLWNKRHRARVNHIIKKHIVLTSQSSGRHTGAVDFQRACQSCYKNEELQGPIGSG
jgi:penicillin-binding protein 1A